jgi:enoyl-CoA hydratase/carnithine racemase
LQQDIWTDEAISDLAERKDRGLIILNSDQRVFAFGGDLSGALACDHNELETVVYVF